MKLILLSLLFIFQARAEELCAPVPDDVIAVLTTLSVPNCRQAASIERGVLLSRRSQIAGNSNSTRNPVCDGCRAEFQTRVSSPVDISVEKKRAFFDTTYKELEKTLSSIVIDAVALRTTYSTNTNFPKSVVACNSRTIEQELTRCNSPFLNAFKEKNLSARLGNETAAIISSNQTGIAGILERTGGTQSCNISDEVVQSLKPRFFEEMITPSIVQAVASIDASNSTELNSNLRNALGENFDVVSKHPILKELMKEPSLFLQTFRSMRNESPSRLKAAFRAAIYNPSMGNIVDSSNASKCENSIRGFTTAMCSPLLKNGNVGLGPFSNFNKFLDRGEVSDSDLTINEGQLKDNLVMFEFCNPPRNNSLSLQQVLAQMNSWMVPDDRDSALSTYASDKFNREFGDSKESLCSQLGSPECREGNNPDCALARLYRSRIDPGSPEARLAASPDRGMNSVLRSLIGEPIGISPQAREILIQEGIIPQANGQLVERPAPPERQPDYLANVANGTINPGTVSQTAASTATTNRRQPARPSGQPQLQQPGPPAAAQTDTQLAAASQDDEDMRRFQDGLDERLRRVEGQQDSTVTPQPAQQSRRVASRADSSGRTVRPPSPTFIPTQTPVQADIVNPDQTAPITPVADAELAPDSTRQTRAQRQANEARAQMQGARRNPAATAEGGRSPASVDGNPTGESSTVALTINGDISSSLEQVLRGSDSRGSDLRSLIEARRPFRFQLNNSLFDVRITNGVYSVTYRSGDSSQRSLASTLQTLFNNSIRNADRVPARDATLEALQNTVRN